VIYHVRHMTRYDYQTPVDLGAHLAHLRPRALPHQKVLRAGVHAAPAVSWRRDGSDHFGNEVTWLFLDVAHAAFQVIADATVDVAFPAPPDPAATPAWEATARQAWEAGPTSWQAAEFLFDSARAPADAQARSYATPSFTPGRPVLAALLDLNARIRRDFTFRPGVTTTSTPIAEVLRRREGVCQDFTHLMISALRAFGLPARYVSGYIRTRPSRSQTRRLGADQSHAWVGAWLGPEHGWLGLDPTNGIVVQDEHVVLGWGRDFGDVTPLRGVILGGGEQALTVEVVLEEVAAPG
jgi:transglutaminase-like putative cysteine protease